jgi:hypothetical protein
MVFALALYKYIYLLIIGTQLLLMYSKIILFVQSIYYKPLLNCLCFLTITLSK